MAYYNITRIEKVAEAISDLTFSEMMDFARSIQDHGLLDGLIVEEDIYELPSEALADVLSRTSKTINNALEVRMTKETA